MGLGIQVVARWCAGNKCEMEMSNLDYEKHTLELAKTLRIDLAEARKTIASSVLEGTMPKPTDTVMTIPPYLVIQALTEQLATEITGFVTSCFDDATQQNAVDLATQCQETIVRFIDNHFDLMKESAQQHMAEADAPLDPKVKKALGLARQAHGDGQ